MSDTTQNDTTQYDFVADGATIASSSRVLTKLGRVEVREGHIGLFRENGDLIASGSIASIEVKKTLLYFAMPTILITVDGKKFRVNLSYAALVDNQGDEYARDRQREDNDRFFAVIRQLGGRA